jgi:ribosome recycling factor
MSDEMVELVLLEASEKMDNTVSGARKEFSTVRTGRASSALLEKLTVEAYGVEMKMQEIASFSVPEARQLLVTPHDPTNIGPIEKSIQIADLGLNPSNDGKTIRLQFPPLTQERRRDLVKVVNGMAEDAKTRLRSVRRTARKDLEDLEKDGGVSEDDIRRAESQIDGVIQSHESAIEAARQEKERELLEDI